LLLYVVVPLTLLLWLATALRTALAIARTPRLEASAADQLGAEETLPRVAVFVPVRDEIEHLPLLLETLLAQRGVELEVLVYDDLSTDGSGALLDMVAGRDARLRVVHAEAGPPAGWCGKPHALVRAVEAYQGEASLWLFLDADVELQPETVAALVAELEAQEVDLISPLPTLSCHTFWAALLGPNFASVATMPFPPARVNDPRDPTALFNGQIVLMRREAYQKSGGFAAVKGEILEDVALARRMKSMGIKLRLVEAQELAQTYMYSSFAEHVEGWGKNIFDLVGRSRRRALGLAAFMVTLAWLPLVSLLLGISALIQDGPQLAALGLVGYLLPTSIQVAIRARAKAAPLFAPFAPLSAAVVALTLVRAAFASGPVRWKGRSYPGPASRLSDKRPAC
jgi:cellulose synthase/poly-beta-1,6-N-acetylglucosamine synthase-like glycosyltransferase